MTLDLGKKTGAISLSKGERVSIEKTSGLTARVTWESGTDYDVYAVVLLKDGQELVCSTFGSEAQRNPTPTVLNGAVRHGGDTGRGGEAVKVEEVHIDLTDEIDRIAVVAYSAQSNGTGSFRRYRVTMEVVNQAGDTVTVDADQANANDSVYTCVPALIINGEDLAVERVELYSKPGSEHRPTFLGKAKGFFSKKPDATGELFMDAGARNLYK